MDTDKLQGATSQNGGAKDFPDVFRKELKEINTGRSKQLVGDSPSSNLKLVGLALSGGGIRSATFNLGVLQGMASIRKDDRSLLRYFDYLSTVSGGGYIGSWLTAWIKRSKIADVELELVVPPEQTSGAGDRTGREPEPITHLREYSNYLTPQLGLLSANTWTAIATYIRNLTLNLLFLMSVLALSLLIPRIASGIVPHWLRFEPWELVTWGLPLILLAIVFAITIFVGLCWKFQLMSDLQRECWAKRQGVLLTFAFLIVILCAISFYGPLGIEFLKEWGKTKIALVIGWIGTIVSGILAGRSPLTGKAGQRGWLEYTSRIMPYVAMLGLLVMIAVGVHWALYGPTSLRNASGKTCESSPTTARTEQIHSGNVQVEVTVQEVTTPSDACEIRRSYWGQIGEPLWERIGVLFVILVFTMVAMGLIVDVNEFSMSAFYRNRLVQCYLRASRPKGERKADPCSGLDPKDDLPLSSIFASSDENGKRYDGPYPIINTALNLTDSDELQWQERKAASFVLTPNFCGSPRKNPLLTGYRETSAFADNITLGTALAISGAAFTSNMGYHSSKPVAFFLSLFNVRLGWWVGNPSTADTVWKSRGPLFGFWYLIQELLGQTSATTKYVYLSDGGHFDNLGLYELVRRRCKYIVCCDAGADPAMSFEDLANAIRKIRTDFGIDVEMDLTMLRTKDGMRHSQWHHAFGTIRYDMVEPGSPVGMLVYIKASLTGDEPADVLEYAGRHPDFPHESTLDQFFSESQFESYRRLGEHTAREVFRYAQPSL